MRFEEVMKSCGVDLLKIQEAGCVVFRYPAKLNSQEVAILSSQAKEWGKDIGVNVLVIPEELQIEIIPHILVTKPEIYKQVEIMRDVIMQMGDRIIALEDTLQQKEKIELLPEHE
jgi:hypothetical protein